MKRRLIPFSWTPTSWFLKGDSHALAKAEYEYKNHPYLLARAKAEISLNDDEQITQALIDIDYEYGVIDEYECLKQKLQSELADDDLAIELIKLDMEMNKIGKHDGEKNIANILKEPWVAVINDNLDLTDGPNGFYFEFDWNEYWIAVLRKHGYAGGNDDEVMQQWFTDVCRSEVISTQPQPFNNGVLYDE